MHQHSLLRGLFCIYRAISRILSTFQRSSEPAFDEIRTVMLVQVDGSDGLLDDKCHHLSLPASMTTAHKSMRLTLSPPA